MTRKEKYQDIDLSKLPEKAVEQLNKVKPYLFEDKYDKPENKEVKDKAEAAMDNLYKIISEKYPESIKSKVAKAPEPKTPQAKAKQIAQQTIVQPKKGQTTAKAKPSKRGNVGAVAKQIRKDGERWQDALKRAAQMINDEQKKAVTNANKQYKKLSAFLKKHPIPAGSTTIEIDAARKALPVGKRKSKDGNTYYEYRENRIDRTRKGYPYLELGGKIGKYAKGGETSRGNRLASVKVIFANPKYNYVTSINGSVTEKEARKYFVGKMLDVGTYPTEDMQKVIDIEFNPKGHFAKGGETLKKKAPEYAKGGKVSDGRIKTIKESDIQVGRKFNLANGDTMKIVRLFKENIDEDWAEYTYRGKNGEGSVNYLKNFINTWRGTVPHEFKKGGRIGKDWQGRKNKESWGKQDLLEQYDNNIDLIADVHDYYKAIAEESGKDYSDNLKKQMIDALNTGVASYSDGATLKFAKGGQVGFDERVNELYRKSGFINDDFNSSLKLLEMLQDNSIEAYHIYESMTPEQKEDLVREQFEMDNDMGGYGDGDIETSRENVAILVEGAKNGKKYAEGGLINLKGNVPAKPYPVIDTDVPVIK